MPSAIPRDAQVFIQRLAREAGVLIREKFGRVGVKYTKRNPADVVTEADLVANSLIVGAIRKKYPDHAIISEETVREPSDSAYTWIIDPLDGTRNFATGTPLFCTMIALAKGDEVELAAVYDPMHDDLYFAKKNGGAFLNGKRMHCSKTKLWAYSFGCGTTNIKPRRDVPGILRKMEEIAPQEGFWMSAFGSTGLCLAFVAAGKRDWAFIGGEVWDCAAPSLLIKEAGGVITDIAGKAWRSASRGGKLVAGNKYLQPKLLRAISRHASMQVQDCV